MKEKGKRKERERKRNERLKKAKENVALPSWTF